MTLTFASGADIEKVSAPSLRASKERGERLVCLTAYDYPTARIVDEAGIDVILVGDSLGNVVLGYGNTVPVTLDEILIHVKAVRRQNRAEADDWICIRSIHPDQCIVHGTPLLRSATQLFFRGAIRLRELSAILQHPLRHPCAPDIGVRQLRDEIMTFLEALES